MKRPRDILARAFDEAATKRTTADAAARTIIARLAEHGFAIARIGDLADENRRLRDQIAILNDRLVAAEREFA